MKLLFWLPIFLIIYSYFGYPLVLKFLSVFKKRKNKKNNIIPFVTLLITVYNEEKIIEKKIKNSLSLDYPKNKLEIIVASESNDKTNKIVNKYKKKGIKLFAYNNRKGKQYTIYRTIPKCSGDIIVFTDGNSIFKKDALKEMIQHFADKSVGCVSGKLFYRGPQKSTVSRNENFYWRYETWLKKFEGSIGSLLGANGAIYAIRKKLYSPLSKDRGDDFELPIRVAQQGYQVLYEPQAIAYENSPNKLKNEFKRRVRISGWVWLSAWKLLIISLKKRQGILIFELLSHKILRWLGGIFLLIVLITNIFLIDITFYKITFVLQIIFYLLSWIIYLLKKRKMFKKISFLFSIPYYFLSLNIALSLGVLKSISRRQKSVWDKTRD